MDGIRRVAGEVVRAPLTRRAWRELLYCAAGAIAGVAGFFLVLFTLAPALLISASVLGTVVGLLMIVFVLIMARRLGALHRILLRRVIGYRITAPAPFQRGEGVLGRLDRRLRDRDGWRAVGYAELKLPVAIVQGWAVVAVGMGLVDMHLPAGVAAVPQPPGGHQAQPADRA